MIGRVGPYAPVSRRLKSNAKRQVISMYLKNLAAAGMSALLLFSGAVSAGAAETVPATHDSETYAAAVETLASNGLAAASATSLQAADGLQLAQEAGLLDESGEELSLTELSAQALLRETEALQKQLFLETYDGVLVHCDSYISLREEPSTEADRLRIIFDGKAAKLLDVYDDEWYEVSYGTDTGFVLAEYCEPVHYADYEGTSATSTLIEDIIAEAYTYLGTPYRYGGSSHNGTDCSGFTMAVFGAFGVSLPHGATSQYYMCRGVSSAERAPGDLVFFATGGSGIGHVGIYLGGGQFIHASTSSGVIISSLSESYYARTYLYAARLIEG